MPGLTRGEYEGIVGNQAAKILRLREENLGLDQENERLRAELTTLQHRYDLATIPPGCEKGEKWRCNICGGIVEFCSNIFN